MPKAKHLQGMVGNTYNPSIWETEAGGSQVGIKPRLHSEALSQTTKDQNNRTTKDS